MFIHKYITNTTGKISILVRYQANAVFFIFVSAVVAVLVVVVVFRKATW